MAEEIQSSGGVWATASGSWMITSGTTSGCSSRRFTCASSSSTPAMWVNSAAEAVVGMAIWGTGIRNGAG